MGKGTYAISSACSSSERSQLVLVFGQTLRDLLLDIGKSRLDVVHEDSVESSREVRSTAVRSFASVTRVTFEEILLVFQGLSNRTLVVDITLTSVDDWDVT